MNPKRVQTSRGLTVRVIARVCTRSVVIEVAVVVAVGVGPLLDFLHEGVDQSVHLKSGEGKPLGQWM